MKMAATLVALICCAVLTGCAVLTVGNKASIFHPATAEESKTQPKEVTLDKDSQSDKYGEVPFNHENHATKNYSVDGKSLIACVECHHTDQPASALKPPLKKSERDVALTAALLQEAGSKAVKTCRTCHLQAGDDSTPLPTVTYSDNPTPKKMTNDVAYHKNCDDCHDRAIAARPVLKIPGTNDCFPCHKRVS